MFAMKLTAITSIRKTHYKGKVHDLTVEKDHSYNIDGIVVHNSLCTTRIKTGHGVPTVTSIMDCSSVADEYGIPVITDGGIRNSGDIAKALACGADSVMLGSLIAGAKETPGPIIERRDGSLWKRYRGSASLDTKSTHGQSIKNVEGESTDVPLKGGVKYIVAGLNDGLRSALSYSGADTIGDFQIKALANIVTNAGMVEAKPHLLQQ